MFICRAHQKPCSVLSALCSVYKLLRLSLSPLHPTSSLIMKESPQECYAKLHAADVRLLGRGRIPLIPFILHCTHARRERERARESAEGIPMGPSLLVSAKCLQRQLQTQVCVMLGKPAAEHQNHPKSSSDLHFTEVQWIPPPTSIELVSAFCPSARLKCQVCYFQFFFKAMIRPDSDSAAERYRHLDSSNNSDKDIFWYVIFS